MADPARSSPLASLRAQKLEAEKLLRLAELREYQARKALLEASSLDEADRRVVAELSRREVAKAEAGAASAADALENALADLREAAGEDDAVGPQTDYRLREILAKLHHHRQRATYAAVGGLLNASPAYVRAWFRGSESPENSWAVSAVTGAPSDYPSDRVHPSLRKNSAIHRTADELLAWLQAHRLMF